MDKFQSLLNSLKKGKSPFYVGLVVYDPKTQKILLGKRTEDSIWTGPGGGADPMESPSQAAIREGFEEANLKLKESDLEELPTLETENDKLCHCFLVKLDPSKQEIRPGNDPDSEVKKWDWYPLDADLPGDTDKCRLTAINNAKMKVMGMKKSEMPMDRVDGTTVETNEYAVEARESKKSPWLDVFDAAMTEFKDGDVPTEIYLKEGHFLFLSRVEDGLYSGYVKRDDIDGLPETTLHFEKLTLSGVVQFLTAKELIEEEKQEEPKPEPDFASLIGKLRDTLTVMGDLNITLKSRTPGAKDLKPRKRRSLYHYSPHENLKTIDPAAQGSGVDARTKGRETDVPHSFYYMEDKPEDMVRARSKAKYTVEAPENFKVYDMGKDEHGILKQLREESKNRPVNPGMVSKDEQLAAIKNAGYHGFHNSQGALPHAVGVFDAMPTSKEERVTKSLIKGKELPVGTVRTWHGKDYIKQSNGQWIPVPANRSPQEQHGHEEGHALHHVEPSESIDHMKPDKRPPEKVKEESKKDPEKPETKPRGGHVSITHDDLKTALDKGPFSVISAGRNPADPEDKSKTDEDIEARYNELEQELQEKGYKYSKVRGNYDGEEDSFVVYHANESEINKMGTKYKQDSVIHSKDGDHKMTFTTGENKGKHYKGSGWQETPDAENYYSEIDTTEGKKIKFSLNFDFGKLHGEETKKSLIKGKELPPGTIREWGGVKYMKETNGHWMPVPTPGQTAPQEDPSKRQPAAPEAAPAPKPKAPEQAPQQAAPQEAPAPKTAASEDEGRPTNNFDENRHVTKVEAYDNYEKANGKAEKQRKKAENEGKEYVVGQSESMDKFLRAFSEYEPKKK